MRSGPGVLESGVYNVLEEGTKIVNPRSFLLFLVGSIKFILLKLSPLISVLVFETFPTLIVKTLFDND